MFINNYAETKKHYIHTDIYAPKSIEIESLFSLEKPADWSYDFFHQLVKNNLLTL